MLPYGSGIQEIKVLDHGYVRILDIMGDDRTPARAARLSFNDGKPRSTAEDMKLTASLMARGHTTPFEMVEVMFEVKAPIFVFRQWHRHRTANINEFSMRYADPERIADEGEIDYYTPAVWRGKATAANKQGSTPTLSTPEERALHDSVWPSGLEANLQAQATNAYIREMEAAIRTYRYLEDIGAANELARLALPVSVYSKMIWKNDLHNILHFLDLRSDIIDDHAQWEMRQYANAMMTLLAEQVPGLIAIYKASRAKDQA